MILTVAAPPTTKIVAPSRAVVEGDPTVVVDHPSEDPERPEAADLELVGVGDGEGGNVGLDIQDGERR